MEFGRNEGRGTALAKSRAHPLESILVMATFEQPLYDSRPSWRSLGARYMVFGDRIELRSMFGFFTVPFSDIITLEKAPPNLQNTGRKLPTDWYRSYKLDASDFKEHLELHRRTGGMRWLNFTPRDLDGFLDAVRRAGGIR